MRTRKRKDCAAFTLIELTTVVAIVGILSVLAVQGVRGYVADAKTIEARDSLALIARDATEAYEGGSLAGLVLRPGTSTNTERSLCPSEEGTVPEAPTAVRGTKYQSTVSEWSAGAATRSGFACLKFTIDSPQYFMYGYTSTATLSDVGSSFTAFANGDLNGDGVMSTFWLTGVVGPGFVLHIAPNIAEIMADE